VPLLARFLSTNDTAKDAANDNINQDIVDNPEFEGKVDDQRTEANEEKIIEDSGVKTGNITSIPFFMCCTICFLFSPQKKNNSIADR
jgi:hypothetical protein